MNMLCPDRGSGAAYGVPRPCLWYWWTMFAHKTSVQESAAGDGHSSALNTQTLQEHRVAPERVRALVGMEEGLQGRLGRRPALYGVLIVFGVVLVVSVLGRVVLDLAPAATTDAEHAVLRTVVSVSTNLAGVGLVAALLSRLGWWREVGFVGPSQWRSLRLLAFPAVLGVVSVVGGLVNLDTSDPARLVLGLPAPFFTGFWEEGLTRGILLSLLLVAALRSGRGPMSAVLLSALAFGLMHLIYLLQNGKTLPQGLGQVALATLIGISFGALLLRTNALWLLALVHMSFDIDSVLVGTTGDDGAFEGILTLLPLTAYSLFLLRRVKSDDRALPDVVPMPTRAA